MTQYMTIPEAAVLWKTTPDVIRSRCVEHQISGAVRFGRSWLIPETVEKPPMLNSPVLRPMLQSEPFPREQTEKRRKNKNNSWTSAQKLDCAVKVE